MSGSVQKAAEGAVISKLADSAGPAHCLNAVLEFCLSRSFSSPALPRAQVDRLTITHPIVPQERVNHAIVKIPVAEGDRDSLSELGTKARLGHPAVRK